MWIELARQEVDVVKYAIDYYDVVKRALQVNKDEVINEIQQLTVKDGFLSEL